jgi:hypothetical protein
MNRSFLSPQARRSSLAALFLTLLPPLEANQNPAPEAQAPRYAARTEISVTSTAWRINGEATYPGSKAEGLLMNVRMVNSTFEDAQRPEFDAEANTAKL